MCRAKLRRQAYYCFVWSARDLYTAVCAMFESKALTGGRRSSLPSGVHERCTPGSRIETRVGEDLDDDLDDDDDDDDDLDD